MYLSQTFLPSPHRGVNDFEEELTGPRVEDENGSIDGLRGQVTLKGLLKQVENTCHYILGIFLHIIIMQKQNTLYFLRITKTPFYLVDSDSVDIRVIHKPDDLVREQFTVVL